MKTKKVKGIFKPETALNWWGRFQYKKQKKVVDLEVKYEGLAADREKALDAYRVKRAEFIKAIDEGIDLNRDKITFKAMIAEYMQLHGSLKKSAANDASILARLLGYFEKEVGEGVLLKRITPQAISRYRAARLAEVSKARVNREMAALKTLFSKAIEFDRIDTSPFRVIKMFREEGGPLRYLSTTEREALYAASPEWLLPILKTAVLTGMRKSEILTLTWKDVYWEMRQINVRSTNTKSGKERQIPMDPELYDILKRLPKRAGVPWVFSDEQGRKYSSYGAVRTTFDNVVAKMKRAGIPHFRFHDLRHTFASVLVGNGADVAKVQQLMGHSTILMTMRYAHLSPGHLRDTIALLRGPKVQEKENFSTVGAARQESWKEVSDGD